MTSTVTNPSGLKIAYDVAGSGDRSIVFVHGRSSNRTYFADQVEYFSRTHTVVTVDLRGMGESEAPADPATTTVADFAEDVRAVVTEVGLNNPVIIGHSMGSDVALQCAADGGFSGAVLLDPFLSLGHELDAYFAADIEAVRNDDSGARRRALIEYLFPPTDTIRRDEIVEDFVKVPKEVDIGCNHAMATFEAAEVLGSLKVPLLVISAALGAAPAATEVPPSVTDIYPSAFVGITVGAGHFLQIQVPDQVNAMIDRFLKVSGIES